MWEVEAKIGEVSLANVRFSCVPIPSLFLWLCYRQKVGSFPACCHRSIRRADDWCSRVLLICFALLNTVRPVKLQQSARKR
jgi:hypothetical protein